MLDPVNLLFMNRVPVPVYVIRVPRKRKLVQSRAWPLRQLLLAAGFNMRDSKGPGVKFYATTLRTMSKYIHKRDTKERSQVSMITEEGISLWRQLSTRSIPSTFGLEALSRALGVGDEEKVVADLNKANEGTTKDRSQEIEGEEDEGLVHPVKKKRRMAETPTPKAETGRVARVLRRCGWREKDAEEEEGGIKFRVPVHILGCLKFIHAVRGSTCSDLFDLIPPVEMRQVVSCAVG